MPLTHPAIIGLGYVGLPLAVEFGKHLPTVGFDINPLRIQQLRAGVDASREMDTTEITAAQQLRFTDQAADLAACNVFIVTVPTPVDDFKRPDLSPLLAATRTIAGVLKRGDLVVYESTVYPGCTEEDCVPLLERLSGLRLNVDFHVGYSPERINPGDRTHRLTNVVKVISGSNAEALDRVDALYRTVVQPGTYRAASIQVAEAAKVIENTQRDINIALVNELAMLFNRLGLDTQAVLDAAGTKWNFLPFRPGLVGGHCIGVDPYYLTHKAQSVGFHPEVILSGRRVNDGMGRHVARQLIKGMIKQKIAIQGARVLVMGLTFKENCSDVRNTRVVDIVDELREHDIAVDVFDPVADLSSEAPTPYPLLAAPTPGTYDGVVLAVAHQAFKNMGIATIRALGKPVHTLFDVKNLFAADEADLRL
ncbi:nucleotide sugar dehydrogenase [Macromonas nakdongensis]|uniref:nucleotide sugar dehydrogenase n=1 Tax=Macromonas nakdongensis TaxID=1843082 RepID=UPI0018E2A7F0|nr:nucleotide sugar dehydrogenase [Macromonas nakdongensis]